jgi:putative ABC transport system permease protein
MSNPRSWLAPIANALRIALARVGEGFGIAFDSMRGNPVRTGLTILGVGVGVGSVVLMAALITGVRGVVQEGIESAGPRNFFVSRFDFSDISLTPQRGRPAWQTRPAITLVEANRVGNLPAIRSAVLSLGVGGTAEARGVSISGVEGGAESVDWPDYRPVTFVQGRNFVEAEERDARSVVVISSLLAQDLFEGSNPIGQRIRLRDAPLTVIGVVEPQANVFNEGGSHLAIVPYTTALRRMGLQENSSQMVVIPRDDVDLLEAEDQVIGLMRGMRGLAPAAENDFSIMRSTQILELFDRFTAVFFIIMISLSSVGLLVGGVGVVGIMLISVTERTREIGIRKSLGATRAEILWQFLAEASALTFLGGAVGIVIGGGLAYLIARLTPLPASVPLWAVAAALLVAAFTGVVFGIAPAARAARMDPVAALRYE